MSNKKAKRKAPPPTSQFPWWAVAMLAVGAALIVLVIGYWVANILRNTIRRVCERRNLDITISGFAGNLAHAAVMAFVVVTVLGVVGVPTTTLATSV